MSESSGEKTELPTPKKSRDARAKGQVAKSQEVVTTVSLTAVIAVIWVTFGSILAALTRLLDQVARLENGDFRQNAANAIFATSYEVVGIVLPILGVVIVAGIAANYFQVGAIFAFGSVAPKLEKISPGAGFKRIFSMKQVVEILKSIAKIVILSVLLYFVVRESIGAYVASLRCGLTCQIGVMVVALRQIFLYSALAFIVVAAADFMYQRHAFTKSLMMSKEEVKREYKESEGDPHIKSHRRQLSHELIMGDGGETARKGTAVVVNPVHLAVVLNYDPERTPLPLVSAKGSGNHAHFLRTEAERAGVPIFRNVTLARALYATVDINGHVPEELFDAVAEVLAWVKKNRHLLHRGPLEHGVIDMDANDHRIKR